VTNNNNNQGDTMNEAVSITVVLSDGTIHSGQSTNGIKRSEMTKCFYTLADGTTVDALVREKRAKK
jgi:hypothetical protein